MSVTLILIIIGAVLGILYGDEVAYEGSGFAASQAYRRWNKNRKRPVA